MNMRLRKNIRTPVRFEDETVNFDIPKKKQLTVPAFPEKMAEQVTQFNKDSTPAAFPSLTLSRVAPSLILANEPLDESDSDSDMGDIENTDRHELICIGEEADITWTSLELAVQHRIWINLRRRHSQEHAATLLQLSEVELQHIRVAVEKRRQCPIDSSRILATLDAVDDCHGTLMAQLTPYILIAQSYELAFPTDVERGRRYVRKLQLEGDEWYVGAWWPDPEGSGYLKCVPDTNNNASAETAPTVGPQYPPTADEAYAIQAGAVPVSQAEPNTETLPSSSNRRLSDSEYREAIQAKAAKLRFSRATGNTSSHIIPQKRPNETNDPPEVSTSHPQAVQKQSEPKASRRPIVIQAGRDPEQVHTTIVVAAPPNSPKTPVRNEPSLGPVHVGLVDQMTPQVVSQALKSMPDPVTPVGNRSSGSMSLRSRDSLRETPAMVSMRQNATLLGNVLDDDATSESGDDTFRQPHTLEKKVTLRINKNAYASIFRGEQKIRAGYSGHQSNLSPNKKSHLFDSVGSNGIIMNATGAVDDPQLFVKHMSWSKLAKAERQRLLSKPVGQRNTVEMWLIYGTNTWKSDAPWNGGGAAPMFTQPALGASLNPDQAGSVLGRFLLVEWNRFQRHGVGQDLFEETAVGSILVYFYAKMMEMKQTRQNLIRDEHDLEASGHVSHNQDRIDPHRRFHEEQQHWQRQLKLALNGEYIKRFRKIGKAIPSVDFCTPSVARVIPNAGDSQTPNVDQTLSQRFSAFKKSPEQPTRTTPSKDFAMKLIETPSTGAGRATTPPEDDLGIFGAKDVGIMRGAQPADFTTKHALLLTPTRNDNSHFWPARKDNNVLNKQETGTQLVLGAHDQMGLSTANLPAVAEDIVIVDASPKGVVGPSVKNVTIAGTPTEQKQSPRRPSWSPISDNEEFHSNSNTPVLSHGQRSEDSSPRVIYTPGRLTFLLEAALCETTQPISEAGELVNDKPDVESGEKLQDRADLLEAAHIKESVMPSIESEIPVQDKQVGKPGTKPKFKLTIKQPVTLNSTAPVSPENSFVPTTEQDPDQTSPHTSKDATPDSEVSSMVTRSMTATPVPGEMPPSVTGPTKKRKEAPKPNLKPKGTKKIKSATPVHIQIDAIKREDAANTPATIGNAKAAVTSKASGPKKAKAKSTTAASTTPRRPRGPYKKTREKKERVEAEKEASIRAGEKGVADIDAEGAVQDAAMTG